MGRLSDRLAPPPAWIAAAAAALALIGGRAAVALDRGDEASMPATALAHVPADLRAKPVFNEHGRLSDLQG